MRLQLTSSARRAVDRGDTGPRRCRQAPRWHRPANSVSLAADHSARGWGGGAGRSGCARRPLTSYPGTGRKSALLGRVRTCQGAC